MKESESLQDRLIAEDRLKEALKHLNNLSEEQRYDLLQRAKEISFEDARGIKDIEEYLMMRELSNIAAKKIVNSLSGNLLDELKASIYKKVVDQTI